MMAKKQGRQHGCTRARQRGIIQPLTGAGGRRRASAHYAKPQTTVKQRFVVDKVVLAKQHPAEQTGGRARRHVVQQLDRIEALIYGREQHALQDGLQSACERGDNYEPEACASRQTCTVVRGVSRRQRREQSSEAWTIVRGVRHRQRCAPSSEP